jgi:hypothetical protein
MSRGGKLNARNVDLVRRSIDLFTQGMRPVVQAAMERRYDMREASWLTAAWRGIKRNPGAADKPAADAQLIILARGPAPVARPSAG